jgi:hypothetical protein
MRHAKDPVFQDYDIATPVLLKFIESQAMMSMS